MRILFEEHSYKPEDIKDILNDLGVLQDVERNINISYVGYFYSETVKDCVFILPKVLLSERKDETGKKFDIIADTSPRNKEADYIRPEDIIHPNGQKKFFTDEYAKFIFEFAVWIYRALSVYRQKKDNRKAIYYKQVPQASRGKRHPANTFLDILLSLTRFNKENKDFLMFTIRSMHSGLNKINWTKTIAKSNAFVQDGTPVYIDPVNKKRRINFDEELFIIFFSILKHINDTYGFRAPINFQYNLIGETRFKQYLNGYGQLRLRQIKYKYFSDTALQLWDLCYAFFESTHKLSVNTDQKEYLLAKNFEIVFEAMIDELVGDADDIPRGLKKQEDGKRVDHMYRFDALIRDDEEQTDEQIYYIGDSKYYKSGHKLGKTSIYKQFTYARNVVQWNLDLFLDEKIAKRDMDDEEFKDYEYDTSEISGYKKIRLRKDNIEFSTEGYNVIPNFFISAFVYPDRKYNAAVNLIPHGEENQNIHISYQFENRLFDRDTLILSHYDVNFLYVVYLYARNHQGEKNQWQRKVRKKFRDEIRKVLEEKFDFYAMKAYHEDDAIDFMHTHFKELNGKIYTPYGINNIYSLALTHDEDPNSSISKENQDLYALLKKYFAIVRLEKTTSKVDKLKLGDNPEPVLRPIVEAERAKRANNYIHPQWLTKHHLERYTDNTVVVGYYRSEEHLRWILGNNNRGTLIYNVRAHRAKEAKDEVRAGSHTENWYNKQNTRFVILYTDGYETTGEYYVFHVKDHAYLKQNDVLATGYPTKDPNGNAESDYYLYRFDEEVSIGDIDVSRLIHDLNLQALGNADGYVPRQPLFITCEELINYRR